MKWIAGVVVVFCLESALRINATYTFSVRVHQFSNPGNLDFNGGCCESSCSNDCDNYFIFCLRPMDYPEESNFCPLGTYSTIGNPITGSVINFTIGTNLAPGVPNPLVYTGDTWGEGFQLLVRIFDNDADADDLIDEIFVNRDLEANDLYVGRQTYSGAGGSSSIDLDFQASCSANFYGPQCTVVCDTSVDDDTGHFTCTDEGERVCLDGWQDPATRCLIPVPGEVGWEQLSYLVEEGGTVTICAAINGTIGNRSFGVNYTTQNGRAEAPSDYSAESGTWTLTSAAPQMCVDIDTTTDTAVEDDECFTVVLSSFLGEEVLVLNPANTTVCIDDDDELQVSFINDTPILNVSSFHVEFEINGASLDARLRVKCVLKHQQTTIIRRECSGGYFEEDNLATGHYKFKVKVKDRSTGMKATVKASFKVATDEGFCNVIPINGVEVSGNDATIEWASTGDPSIFSCSLDRGARSNCISPYSLTGLQSGNHRLRIIPHGCSGRKIGRVRFDV